MKKITFLIICIFISANLFAEENATLAELEFKLKTLEEINTKLVNSIYWTIALVGAIFSAVVALNFYQNFVLHTKKIDAIKSDLNDYAEKIKAELIQENDSKVDSSLSLIGHKAEMLVEKKLTELKNKFTALENEYKDLKRESLIVRAQKHKDLGQRGYLLNYLEVLRLDLEKGYDWRIFETLEKLFLIAKEEIFSAEDGSRFNESLKKVLEKSDKYEQIINSIKSNIKIEKQNCS